MGRLILIVLAAIALFIIISALISALHFLFRIAVVALLVFAGLRLVAGARRRSRREPPRRMPAELGRSAGGPMMASGGTSGYGSEA